MKMPLTLLSLCAALQAAPLSLPSAQEMATLESFSQPEACAQIEASSKQILQEMGKAMDALNADFMQALSEVKDTTPLTLPADPVVEDESSITCEKGLSFDIDQSLFTYYGNVRMRDAQFELDCESLSLKLAQQRQQDFIDEQQETIAKQIDTGKQASPSGEPSRRNQNKTPIRIKAEEVYLKLSENEIFMRGADLLIQHGKSRIELKGINSRAYIEDKRGLIYLNAEQINAQIVQADGQIQSLQTQGRALFWLEHNSLLLPQGALVTNPQGQLSCAGMLRIELKIKEGRANAEYFPRLNGLQIERLGLLTARDQVKLAGKTADSEPFELRGELLSYDAGIGEVLLAGQECQAHYGKQNLKSTGEARLKLFADGSLLVAGAQIKGRYLRPVKGQKESIIGEFSTQKRLSYRASDLFVEAPEGLELQDALTQLRSGGLTRLYFTPAPTTEPLAAKPAETKADEAPFFTTPQLALTELGEMQRIEAQGGIYAQSQDEAQPFTLQAASAQVNLKEGSAKFIAERGQWVQISFGSNSLRAMSPEIAATLTLKPNGDMNAQGEQIEAQFAQKGQEQATLLNCAGSMQLEQATGTLTLERDVKLQAEQAHFSTRGRLTALLLKDAKAAKAAQKSAYPQLSFPYTGIKSALAHGQSSIRTPEISLQCEELLSLELSEEERYKKLSGLKTAQAQGQVRVAFRDKDKKLYRATGERLQVDGATGIKTLSGARVTLSDSHNTHEARGAGARVRVDARNNATLYGAHQTTRANQIPQQLSPKKP